MSLGSLVRATDSGLACPDWPLCYGRAVPVFDLQIFLEWFHRVLAGGLTLGIGYLGWLLIKYPILRKKYGIQLIAASALLVIQIILGGLTVLKLLEPGIVSLHLINAVLFYVILFWTYKSAKAAEQEPGLIGKRSISWFRLYLLLTFLIFLQIFLGGMVSTSHAGLVCPDFPTCHGSWWPAKSHLVWLQMAHRYAAFLLFILAAFGAAMATGQSLPHVMRHKILLIPVLMLVQILLGVVNIYWHLPTWASVLHLANALVVFTVALDVTLSALTELKFRNYHLTTGKSSRLAVMREAGL